MCRFMRSFTPIWPMIHEREVFNDGKKMEEKMSSNATKKPAATAATNHTTKGKETKENNKTMTDFFKPTKKSSVSLSKPDISSKPVDLPYLHPHQSRHRPQHQRRYRRPLVHLPHHISSTSTPHELISQLTQPPKSGYPTSHHETLISLALTFSSLLYPPPPPLHPP